MKHRLKNIRPPVTPRQSMTIALALSISIIAALATIAGNLASTAVPDALKPYVPYSWPALGIILLLGIIVTFWQVWYASGQSANNGVSSTPAAQLTMQPAQQTVVASSSSQSIAPAASAISQAAGTTTPSQSAQQTPASGTTPATSVSPAPVPGSAHYHTCVIGYSDKDKQFVNKLYADLKSLGVPCLLVEQDLKIGDKLREEIYRAVRQLDKLLLVLSHNAIESKWVEEAVDVALDRERQQPGTYLLFPLRLDNAVLDTDKYWAIAVRQRLIGDFRHWQQDAGYQQALQRVLRDLRV